MISELHETLNSYFVTLERHQTDSRGVTFCDIFQKSFYRKKIGFYLKCLMQFLQKSEMVLPESKVLTEMAIFLHISRVIYYFKHLKYPLSMLIPLEKIARGSAPLKPLLADKFCSVLPPSPT